MTLFGQAPAWPKQKFIGNRDVTQLHKITQKNKIAIVYLVEFFYLK